MKINYIFIFLSCLTLISKAQKITLSPAFKSEYCQGGKYLGKINDEHYIKFDRGSGKELIRNTTVFSNDLKTVKRDLENVYGHYGFIYKNEIFYLSQNSTVEKKIEENTLTIEKFNKDGGSLDNKVLCKESKKAITITSKGELTLDFRFFHSSNNKLLGVAGHKKFWVFDLENLNLLKEYSLNNYVVVDFSNWNVTSSNLDYYLMENGDLITVQKDKAPITLQQYKINAEEVATLKLEINNKENFGTFSCLNDEKNALLVSTLFNGKVAKNKLSQFERKSDAEGCNVFKISLNDLSIIDQKIATFNEKVKTIEGKNADLDKLEILGLHEINKEYFLIAEKHYLYQTDKGATDSHDNLVLAKLFGNNQSIQTSIRKRQYHTKGVASYIKNGMLYLVYQNEIGNILLNLAQLDTNLMVKKILEEDVEKKQSTFIPSHNLYPLDNNKFFLITCLRYKYGFVFIE